MKSLKYLYVCLFALATIHLCSCVENGTVTDTTTSDGEPEQTSLEKGMEPVFEMYHNFLQTVMPSNFYDSASAFNVDELIDVINKDNYGELQGKWQDMSKTFGGFAGCIVVGMIFFVFMPILGFVYCCVHCCCHKCGGTRARHDPKHAKCLRVTFVTLLLVCATLMLAGAIIVFLGAELLHKSLINEGDNGMLGRMDKQLGKIEKFTNDTLKSVQTTAQDKVLDKGLFTILPRVEEAANSTVVKVKATINATDLLDKADELGKAAQNSLTDLDNVNSSLTQLNELQVNVTNIIDKVKADVDAACTSPCDKATIGSDSLKFNPDFSALDKLKNEADKVRDAQNITTLVSDAKKEFDKVYTEVDGKVADEINKSRTEINNMNKTISKQIDDLSRTADPFINGLHDGSKFASREIDLFKDIGKYMWYSCIGIGCVVLLVVMFYYLGVLFGLCGERPGVTAACCNKGTGASLLCTGICCTFLFAWILMLLVIIMFSLGGLSYTMACRYLKEVEGVSTFEAVLSRGFKWNVSSALNVTNLTMSGMMLNCKANQGLYTAFHLDSIFDIDKEFDVSSVKTQVSKMLDTGALNLENITLLPLSLKTQLENYADAGLTGINLTNYTVQLNKDLMTGDLTDIINKLKAASVDVRSASPTNADKLNDSATALSDMQSNELVQIETQKQSLSAAVSSLQQHSNVTDLVNSLTTSIKASEDKYNSEKDDIVKAGLQTAVDDTLTLIDNIVNDTKDDIKNNIGKCAPVYNAAQGIVDAVCKVTLDPFNAIWFGLGWSLFFYIPCFIFAAVLAGLYKRPERYHPKSHSDFDDPNHDAYLGYDGQRGGRHADEMPLTRIANGHGRDKGASNYAYEGRESHHDPRYHRDDRHSYHDDYRGGDRAGRGGHGYAEPYRGHRDPYDDQPPLYDEATSRGYEGYPRKYRY